MYKLFLTKKKKYPVWKNSNNTPKCANSGMNEPVNHLDCSFRLRELVQRCRNTDHGPKNDIKKLKVI